MRKLINRVVWTTVFGALIAAGSSPVKDVPLADQVRHELNMLPYYGVFDAITYEVNGNQIRLAAWRTVYSWPTLSRVASMPLPPVRILVKNGDITLVGVVPTQADKDALNI